MRKQRNNHINNLDRHLGGADDPQHLIAALMGASCGSFGTKSSWANADIEKLLSQEQNNTMDDLDRHLGGAEGPQSLIAAMMGASCGSFDTISS